MKEKIKKIIPNFLMIYYRRIINYYNLKKIVRNDQNRFYRHASFFTGEDYSENQLKYRLIYATHGIEKGLSHEDLRLGFGKEQLVYIRSLLDDFHKMKLSNQLLEYQDTINVLSEYLKVHSESEYDVSFFYDIFDDYINEIEDNCLNRAGIISKNKMSNNETKNFFELSQNRYSIRDFSSQEVPNDIIEAVIKLSMKTPSACNRQMWKVIAIKDKEKIKTVLFHQGGFSGYEAPPVLFLITVSLESFQFPRERNQAYVDGGLFSMSILYALEYYNIAACALNSELTLESEEKIREILTIPKDEVMIMFVALGYSKEKYIVCKSPRVDINEILTIVG